MDIRITHVIELSSSLMALVAASAGAAVPRPAAPSPVSDAAPTTDTAGAGNGTVIGENIPAEPTATIADGELDAHGHPWSADLHASTKGKTKDGLWRMKVGVSRPDPLPGFPKDDTIGSAGSTSTAGTTGSESSANTAAATGDAGPATSGEEDDEFAAFRAAAAKSDAEDAAAKANVPARKWTDADLGALCNQAAVKLGDPTPVKEIIAGFIPEGQVAHSRNIPEDKREEFAKAVEAKAGIEFAG